MSAVVYVLIYLAAINVLTFFLYGIDKWKAKRSKWRISEATLVWMAVVGGSFKYGIPFILLTQIALVVWYFWRFHLSLYVNN